MTNDTATAHDGRGSGASAPLLVGAAVGLGAAIGLMMLRSSRTSVRQTDADRGEALADYLRDHLSGSDAALQVAMRLRQTLAGTEGGRLFASLCDEFSEERSALRELLASLEGADHAPKRLAGMVSGGLLALAAGGGPGDLSLFRAVEGLAVGVQGKRCLWRTLQSLGLTHPAAEGRSVADFETMAVRQSDAIEQYRLTLGSATFSERPVREEARAAKAGRV